ncbi:MAG: translation elongation factor Ts [Fimbriimonadales bacterium]
MAFTAADVKRLREETDAPMMECNAALKEADGDYDRAKQILREKGKAAAAKRADRTTSAGVVAFSTSADHKHVGAVVLESETDFVAKNEQFIQLAQEIAEIFLHNDPGNDPLAVKHGDRTVGEIIEAAVATIRENIKITKALHLSTENQFATYIHHDNTKASIIEITGSDDQTRNVGRSVAIQTVAFPPEVVKKDDLPQDKIAAEIETETQRAIAEGKDENIARNIATGRVNKEYIKRVVLLEQPFYADAAKSVGQFLSEEAKGHNILGFTYLAVGQ